MSAHPTQSRSPDRLREATEISLFLVTVAAIVGMHRLFEDGSYRGALVLQALLAHLVVTLLRRAGVRVLPAPVRPEDGETVSGAAVQRLLDVLQKTYDYVVLDLPRSFNEAALTALDQVHERIECA